MNSIRSERKYLEILRILRQTGEPMGAKRLSELMAEHGFLLSDRAVQYYLHYLDEMGFTYKVGNRGRLLTPKGVEESEHALVEERIGFVISKLERLAFRTTFDPLTGTGDVSYNLSFVPAAEVEGVAAAFDAVIDANLGFFSSYRIIDSDPRIPPGHAGFVTVCSVTMDGVLQRQGIPVSMAYGGSLLIRNGNAARFTDLIGYQGTTVDPLKLFISAGLTSINRVVSGNDGIALANVRQVPVTAYDRVEEIIPLMRDSGFHFPVAMGTKLLNLPTDPNRLSIIAYSGMNLIAIATEKGFSIQTEIGAGNIQYSKVIE
jgi:repressor of nif and glnA expression